MELIEISEQRLLQHLSTYRELAESARNDQTFTSDLRAALEIPSVFLTGADRFEATFDGVIHHLSEAMKKASTDHDRYIIFRTAEEMVYIHAFAIEERIRYLREESQRTLRRKIRDFFSQTFQAFISFRGDLKLKLAATAYNVAPETFQLLDAYLQKLILDSRLGQDEAALNLQIGRVYKKFLRSECYSGELTLLSNFFETHKEKVVVATVDENIQAAVELANLSRNSDDMVNTLRVSSSYLSSKGDVELLIEFLLAVQKYHANYLPEIRKHVELGYAGYLSDKSKSNRGLYLGLLGGGGCFFLYMALPLLFLGFVIYIILSVLGVEVFSPNATSLGPATIIFLSLLSIVAVAFFILLVFGNRIRMYNFKSQVKNALDN